MNTIYGHIFEQIDTPEKAYILGLMYADGYLKYGALALQEDDQDILIKISNYTKCNAPYYIKPQENRLSDKGQYKVSMGKETNNFIKHLNNDESLIPELGDLMPHFIRGIFDGDGCIALDNRYIKMHPNKAIPGHFYILFNKREHAEIIQDILCTSLNLKKNKIKARTGLGSTIIYEIRWSGTNTLISIRNYLYQNANLFIIRKKDKFFQIKAGDIRAAALKGNAARMKQYINKRIIWYCKWCGKTLITCQSSKKTYCSNTCAASGRIHERSCNENTGIKREP